MQILSSWLTVLLAVLFQSCSNIAIYSILFGVAYLVDRSYCSTLAQLTGLIIRPYRPGVGTAQFGSEVQGWSSLGIASWHLESWTSKVFVMAMSYLKRPRDSNPKPKVQQHQKPAIRYCRTTVPLSLVCIYSTTLYTITDPLISDTVSQTVLACHRQSLFDIVRCSDTYLIEPT